MRHWAWSSACCMALLIGGCPKRQSGPRLVYVPTPPAAAAAAPAPDSGRLIIEEPAPPEPPVVQAPATQPAPPTAQPKPRLHSSGKSSAFSEPVAEPPADEPAPVKPPALEPANSPGDAERRQTLAKFQGDMNLRLAQFENRSLSAAEQRTLNEAKSFLAQSVLALKNGEFQRAENLAHKADLLVKSLEGGP